MHHAQTRRECIDVAGAPVARYHLENAWPAKVQAENFDASKNGVAIESVELVADSIQRID